MFKSNNNKFKKRCLSLYLIKKGFLFLHLLNNLNNNNKIQTKLGQLTQDKIKFNAPGTPN